MGNKWSLSRKVWSIFGILAVAFMLNSGMAVRQLQSFSHSMTDISKNIMVRDGYTTQILGHQRQMLISTLELVIETDETKKQEIQKGFDHHLSALDQAMSAYEAMAGKEELALLGEYKVSRAKWLTIMRKSQELSRKNLTKESSEVFFSAGTERTEMLKELAAMDSLTSKELETESSDVVAASTTAVATTALVATLSILGSLVLAFFVLRATTRSIDHVIQDLSESSIQVSSASQQIASAAEELSQATNEQAASLEETAASIQEMSSMVGRNSENADRTATQSAESREKANHGMVVVKQMIESMEEINDSNKAIMDSVNESNTRIANIVTVINEIGNKTKVINDIVFQTKLLSFNASVEAARAGEHGKGFAVVAEEVGNLAQMSGNASKEISAMLQGSIQQVEAIVSETKSKVEALIANGTQKIIEGERIARDCGTVLEEIVGNVSQVSDMAKEISAASQEQSQGVSEITKAIAQLDQVTQQNAATSEEAASSAEELSAQADSLKATVQELAVTIRGGSAVASVEHRPNPTAKAPSQKPLGKTAKVIALKPAMKAVTNTDTHAFKKVSGGSAVPSHDDNRFEDV